MNAVSAISPSNEPKWGRLSAPVDPGETWLCMRAQSILSGGDMGQCPPLDLRQARDVLAWYTPPH